MANIRQYIGARYVIKIYENSTNPNSAEWEQGNYEPLVMVTWQNGSYLSKKEVPATAGNPASEPTYWVQTGFYNGQIAALEAHVSELQERVNTIASNLGNTTASLQAEIVNRTNADTSLNAAISSEANARSTTDADLQRQINEIVAPSGEAPNPAEIVNARIGANGVTYDTLGDAIRSQFNALPNNIFDLIRYAITFKNEVSLSGTSAAGTVNFNNMNTFVAGNRKHTEYNVSSLQDKDILIYGHTDSVSSSVDYGLYVFLDSSDNKISRYGISNTVYGLGVLAQVPSNAVKLIVNGNDDDQGPKVTTFTFRYNSETFWKPKTIGVVGSSVPFGSEATTSYVVEAQNELNFKLKMCARPGLAIHTTSAGTSLTSGSLALSISEYANEGITIDNAPIPFTPNGNYNNYYYTYEHVFNSDNSDVDLWIFAVVPNNSNFALTDWELFDPDTFTYTDNSSFASHRTTFIGALLFLMKEMYDTNPNARMCFALDSAFQYSSGKSNLALLSEAFNIPIIDMWGQITTTPQSLEVLEIDHPTDIHPSTFGHQKLGHILAGELSHIC